MSVIQAGNTTTTSLIYTGDTTGNLVFTTGGANTVALTLANTQAATFSGPVTVTGALTATSGVVQGANAAPAFYAYAANSQTFTAGVAAKLQLNTENFDTNSNYSTANYRFTPTVAGYYQFSGSTIISFSGNNGYLSFITIYKNGSEYSRGSVYYTGASSALTAGGSAVSSIIYCNGSTDYIEFWARGDASSGTISTDVGATSYNFGCGCFIRSA